MILGVSALLFLLVAVMGGGWGVKLVCKRREDS